MELFIFGLNRPETICGSLEDPANVCEWNGVSCNAEGEVEQFEWWYKQQSGTGTLELQFLPRTLKNLDMSFNNLSGTIDLNSLPETMQMLELRSNNLSDSDPMDGHLNVVGRSSTPSGGKPWSHPIQRACPWCHRVTVQSCDHRPPLPQDAGYSGQQERIKTTRKEKPKNEKTKNEKKKQETKKQKKNKKLKDQYSDGTVHCGALACVP